MSDKASVAIAKVPLYCDHCGTVAIRPGHRYVRDNGRTICTPCYLAIRCVEDRPECLE